MRISVEDADYIWMDFCGRGGEIELVPTMFSFLFSAEINCFFVRDP
jgi:hypothetical protein